ncbi:hypothetical protein [Microbacterium yannicii]|uniref:hypothetical protein n=1 Tax=Microbacterium yannicii TaxID=671622 RepID=UPI0002FBB40A|nr:hypothetical protein [Microbacterium yannicii]
MARSGTRFSSIVVGAVLAAIALSGCAADAPSPTASPSGGPTASTASPSASPTPTEAPAQANIPTDCAELGSADTRQQTVGDMTLQSNGEGFVRPAPEGATLALGCDWIVGDATGLLLLISTAQPDAVTAAVGELPAEGYSCQVSDDFGADFCTLPGAGADTEEMIVAREGVWIYMSTVNRNGRAFLSEIVQGVLG